jgi:phospho-N-acetylmuramoyl-pentapeptide-transferase
MFRSAIAAIMSFMISLLAGPKIIRWLMSKKIGDLPEFHHTALNELMKDRANTPTMGGIIILLAVITTTLCWAKLDNPFIHNQKTFPL